MQRVTLRNGQDSPVNFVVTDPKTGKDIEVTGTREEQTDLDAATLATVDLSSWAYAANGELDADNYEGVMQPYHLVRVRGIGGYLSGDYLIGRVTHVLTDHGYRQKFSLHRNARSAGGAGGGAGMASGVF